MSTPQDTETMTLAEIEADVAEAIRFKGAGNDEGQEAIKIAEEMVAATGAALKASHAVTGVTVALPRSNDYSAHEIGRFGAAVSGTTGGHKYAFGIRVNGAHGIDVTVLVFLIPKDGEWGYAFDMRSLGTRLGKYPITTLAPVAHVIIGTMRSAALKHARGIK